MPEQPSEQVGPTRPDYPGAMIGPPFSGCTATSLDDAHSGVCADDVWWCIWARMDAEARSVSGGQPVAPLTVRHERCQDCGGANQFVYRASDDAWESVTGQAWRRDATGLWRYHDGERWVYESEGTCIGLLCPVCFEKRAKARGLRLFWTCEADPPRDEPWPCAASQTSTGVDAPPDASRSTPTAHSAELANGSTCGFCGKPADVWPSKDCEEPQEHTTAVYDCDCGDVVTIADAIASPKQHRRCHLIGTGE